MCGAFHGEGNFAEVNFQPLIWMKKALWYGIALRLSRCVHDCVREALGVGLLMGKNPARLLQLSRGGELIWKRNKDGDLVSRRGI